MRNDHSFFLITHHLSLVTSLNTFFSPSIFQYRFPRLSHEEKLGSSQIAVRAARACLSFTRASTSGML
jgi:hypothetical protein